MSCDYAAEIGAARARFDHDANTLTVLDPGAAFLTGQSGNVTSQTGEDGLLAALFDRIGIRNRWCFEVGAGDGVYLSNTKALRDDGWSAVLIEADNRLCDKLNSFADARVVTVHRRIGPDSLDSILREASAPADPDLGVIDIDGQDYYAFGGLNVTRPRVMLVEFNAGGTGLIGGVGVWQAGADMVEELARRKGYTPLARCGCNCLLLLDSEELPPCEVA